MVLTNVGIFATRNVHHANPVYYVNLLLLQNIVKYSVFHVIKSIYLIPEKRI